MFLYMADENIELLSLIPQWFDVLSCQFLRAQIDFCTMEMILGSQNWQDYISKRCVYPLFKWDLCSDGGKNGLRSISSLIKNQMRINVKQSVWCQTLLLDAIKQNQMIWPNIYLRELLFDIFDDCIYALAGFYAELSLV